MPATYAPTPELLALDEAGRIKWAEALESGEYKQGFSELFLNGLCCPLAVLAFANGVSEDQLESVGKYRHIPNLGFDDIFHLPFADVYGTVSETIWKLNDSHKLTFPQIAQLLRGNTVES